MAAPEAVLAPVRRTGDQRPLRAAVLGVSAALALLAVAALSHGSRGGGRAALEGAAATATPEPDQPEVLPPCKGPACIRGSVPTSAQEADDIIRNDFPDEKIDHTDSQDKLPGAYHQGSVDTSAEEAGEIVPGAGSKQDRTVMQRLAQKYRLTKLGLTNLAGMSVDYKKVAPSAFIRGSVPTFQQEADDIIKSDYPDDIHHIDTPEDMPGAYVRGSVDTSGKEATDITGVEKDEKIRALRGEVAALRAQLAHRDALLDSSRGARFLQLAAASAPEQREGAPVALDDPVADSASEVRREEREESRVSAREEQLLDKDLDAYQSQYSIKGV